MGNNYDKISRIRQGYSTGRWQSFKGDHEKRKKQKKGKIKIRFLKSFELGGQGILFCLNLFYSRNEAKTVVECLF